MDRRKFLALGPAFPAAAVTATLTLKREGEPAIEGLDVSILRMQPGDVAVISVSDYIGKEAADQIREAWAWAMPNTRAIVLTGDVKLEGVLRGPDAHG